MNSTGRKSKNSGYLVMLLLVVGLTAFSHSMKELTEIHHLTLDASRLVAQWSGNFTPAEIPQTPVTIDKVVKIEKLATCESHQSTASVELPWLNKSTEPKAVTPARPQQSKIQKPERRVVIIPGDAEVAKLKKLPRINIDADEFEVRIPSVQPSESGEQVSTDTPEFTFKTKARRHGTIRMTPRDRETLLKSLNRSFNLRIAS